MATVIKFIRRELVKSKRMQRSQDGGDKTLAIWILKSIKLNVLLYFVMDKQRVNILWYINNTFCFLDELFMFSIYLVKPFPFFI